jgi:Short-chain dehydrogenases of various substrate specificities
LADEINSKLNRLDVLINNAGTYFPKCTLTEDGIESTFAVNYLAAFLLTNLLLDKLLARNLQG